MTIRRATLSIVGASLLVAWFASAASVALQRPRRYAPPPPIEETSIDALGSQVRARAAQLKARLASPPALQQPTRNPFAFRPVVSAPPRVVRAAAAPAPVAVAPFVPAEPMMALIGIAGRNRAGGVERTAMLATERDEVIIAAVGDVVLQRYKVTAISTDAVELADVATGAPRRLVFQNF